MIAKTNAIELFGKNLARTEMLIVAMEKIKAYNQIYQNKRIDLDMCKMIKSIQDEELVEIERSCGEHAIISLITAFETYYKELLQELLSEYQEYFVSRQTLYSAKVNELFNDKSLLTYEDIQDRLNLNNRFRYYEFLQTYSITILSGEEKDTVEHLYLRRNNYVHNAGGPDEKLKRKLQKNPSPFPDVVVSTEAKRLRTKLRKILLRSYKRVIGKVSAG
jgi:hypothetical protein